MLEKLEVKVCVGSSCHIKGGSKTLRVFENLIEAQKLENLVDLKADLCLNNCLEAPNVVVGGDVFGGVTPEKAPAFFKEIILARVQQH